MAEQFPGPACTQLLAGLGARVILIERPGQGDPQRVVGPWLFRFAGRGKESIELDLKTGEDRDLMRRMVSKADVFIEGFRPGVMSPLGFDADTVLGLKPSIVYCSISGYGQSGPYRDAAGHNINYEAIAGLLEPFLGRPEGDAFLGGPPWGDILSGLVAAVGIVAAVRQAETTGVGARLDLSILDSLVYALGPTFTRHLNGAPGWSARESSYGIFRCRDGHVALGINHEDHMWRALCRETRLDDLSSLNHDERLARRGEIRNALEARLAAEPVAHWVARLSSTGACSRINRLDDVPADPQVQHRGLFVTATDENGQDFTTVRSPFGDSRGLVPPLGRDSAVLRAEFGTEVQAP
jgi:crotonobetainyl-CoA:carnitine CoA-transferase CaiB-like acyl-CoA transferase